MYGNYDPLEPELINISVDSLLIAFCKLTINTTRIHKFLSQL